MVLVCFSHLGMHLLCECCLSHLTIGKWLLCLDISRTLCCVRNAEGCYRVSLFLNTRSRNLEKYRQVHPSLIASEQEVFLSNTRPLPLCEKCFFWCLASMVAVCDAVGNPWSQMVFPSFDFIFQLFSTSNNFNMSTHFAGRILLQISPSFRFFITFTYFHILSHIFTYFHHLSRQELHQGRDSRLLADRGRWWCRAGRL